MSFLGNLFGSGDALTGYNYLKNNPLMNQAQGAGSTALGAQGTLQGQEGALLGLGGDTAAANAAYQNYLGSTGYKFQLGQGQQAVDSNAASKGMLNSGATAKALTQYGQNLGSSYFNNYLGQLGGLNSQYQGTVNAGLGAAQAVGQAGTQGGIAQANENANIFGSLFGAAGKALGGQL